MEGLNQKLLDYASKVIPNMGTATTIAIIVSIVLALIYCFFGYKLLRLHISFVMFVIGATIGYVIGVLMGLDQTFVLALMAVLAILFALVGFFLYKVGLFVMIMVLMASSSYGFQSELCPDRMYSCVGALCDSGMHYYTSVGHHSDGAFGRTYCVE